MNEQKKDPLMSEELNVDQRLLLFVEDDPGCRFILKHFVKALDIEAIYAESGESALQIIQERSDVTCMFLDMSLGMGISGTDLAERIKSKPCYKDVPLIAMTAFEKHQIHGFDNSGFTGYLQKPYSIQELGTIIDMQYAHA